MGWLDSNGLRRVWANIRAALAEKQDRLTGAAGQVVGFDAGGNPAAQSTAELAGPQGEPGPQGPKGDKRDTGAAGPKGPAGPAGADGRSAYQYAVDGGYAGTEAAFKALMAGAATKAYVDSLIEQVKADTMKAMEKIACLVIPTHGTTQRINVKLIPRGTIDYSLTYEGTIPQNSSQYIRLEPPPGYAFTGLAYTWVPALKIGTEYRVGTLQSDGAISFALQASDVMKSFTFVSRDYPSSPAYFKLEVA